MNKQRLSPLGKHLRRWRLCRGMSQLDLSLAAQVSSRHISFLETGRAQPSREMLLRLSNTLDIPLRDRNEIFQAAGYVPNYSETELTHEDMLQIRRALEFILAQHADYPAFVLNRNWDIVMGNQPHEKLLAMMLPDGHEQTEPMNALDLLFDPSLLRPRIVNWDTVVYYTLRRLYRENGGPNATNNVANLLERVKKFIPERLDLEHASMPLNISKELLVPMEFDLDGNRLCLFSTVAIFGTPNDVTLNELRIECFFPADQATETLVRSLASADVPRARR